MKKLRIKKLLSIISLLFMPTLVFASGGNNDFSVGVALGMEAFVSIHMSLFVLKPLADMFSKENSKKTFWTLFAIRAGILIFCDFFVTPFIAIVDFISVFIGAFAVVPICAMITKTQINGRSNQVITKTQINGRSIQVIRTTTNAGATPPTDQVNGIELKCAKCGAVLQITDKFCSSCGEPFDGNNVVVAENANTAVQTPPKVAVLPSNFHNMYSLTEDKMLEEFINRELIKAGVDKTSKLIPSDILKRKKILNIIFSILIFVYITLIFFHFPIYAYVIGLVILFIFFKVTRKYDLIKYLKKQLKARPGEKVSNIVMNVKNTFITDNSKVAFAISMVIAVVLPLIIFSSPRILYEKVENGYAVRYYIFGLSNFKTATIPETYKNEKVVSLRGNTFSNMPFLESVSLPDSVTEIRGQAFKNCYKLTKVNIPKNLEYLGGGAFYNAKSIKRVEFPDTLTYLGGESFYGAKSLEYVKLSNNLTEIRGDSFEYCISLKSITIPDNVTRIGGHAFYGDISLSEVSISENSKLMEIGSSAFRQCSSLYNITIPSGTSVNERAFKESPTTVNRLGYNSYDTTDDQSSSQTTVPVTYEGLLESSIHTNESEYLSEDNTYVVFDKYNVIVNAHVSNNAGQVVLEVRSREGLSWHYQQDGDYIILNKCRIKIVKRDSTKFLIKVEGAEELSKTFQNSKVINLNENDIYKIKDNLSLTLSRVINMNETEYYDFYSNIFYNNENGKSNNITFTKKEGFYILDDSIMLEVVSSGEKQVSVKVYYN